MAEPLAVIGLAGNIVQFLDFSTRIISKSKMSYEESNEFYTSTLDQLTRVHSEITQTLGREADPALWTLALECDEIAKDIEESLEKTKVVPDESGKTTLKQKLRWNFQRDKFKKLDLRIQILQANLNNVFTARLLELQTEHDQALQTIQQSLPEFESNGLERRALDIANQVATVQERQTTGGTDNQDMLATFVASLNLNVEINAILQVKEYTAVTVLPLMWAEASTPYLNAEQLRKSRVELAAIEQELSELGRVFKERFRYDVKKIWKIPDHRTAQRLLNKEIRQLVHDHEEETSLLIIIYGGHGADTRKTKTNDWGAEENNSIWAATTSPQSASVNWTYIQKDLELSDADCLLIIDCCHSGTSITRGEATTITEILAASTHESPSYSGSRAYSKLLKDKLESISLPCSVEQVHQKMLSASRLRPISQSADALRATPDHGWAGDSLQRSIRLRPLPTSDTDAAVPSDDTIEHDNTIDQSRPRMFIEVGLDASQNVETANAEWQRWFTATLPPASMRSLHFHTVEGMYAKVMQERRA